MIFQTTDRFGDQVILESAEDGRVSVRVWQAGDVCEALIEEEQILDLAIALSAHLTNRAEEILNG